MADVTVVDVPRPTGATNAEPQPDRHKKSLFIKEEGETGRKIKEKGITGRGTRQAEVTSKYAEFGSGLIEQYSTYLDNYITELLKLKDIPDSATGKSLYESVLNNPAHLIDRQLVELLSSEERNQRGTGVERSANEAKIKRFLSTPEGKIITTQLLERNTAMRLFAIGLAAAANPEARRSSLAEQGVVRTNIDAGVLRTFEADILSRVPGTPAQRLAFARLSAGLGIAGRLLGGPGGYSLGAAPAAVYGAYRGIEYLRREGLVFNMEQSVGAFKAISGNKVEKAYVKAVFGIDTDDFVVTPAGAIELKVGRVPESLNIKDQQMKVLQGLYTRREFYTALGVPQDRLDALPEQFLYRVSATSRLEWEKTGARWEQRIIDLFQPNKGGIKDTAGRRAGNPLFLTGGADYDYKGNVQRFHNARTAALGEQMQKFLDIEVKRGDNVNTRSVIGEKIRKLSSPEGIQERKAAFEKVKTTLTEDKGLLDLDKTAADAYKTALTELQNTRADLQKEYAKISVVGGAIATSVSEAITMLDSLNRAGTHINIGTRAIDSISERKSDWVRRRNIDIAAKITAAAGTGLSAKDAREEVIIDYQGEWDEIQGDLTFVEELKNNLRSLETNLKTKQEALIDTTETAKKGKKIDSFAKDFQTVTALGITEADLRNLTFDQILAQINSAPGGWPVGQNSRADLRTRTFHAILEAKAKFNNPAFALPAGHPFDTLTNPAGFNISENQLRSLTDKEIETLVIARGGGVTLVDIQNAMSIANSRFTARTSALSDRIDEMIEQISRQDALAAGVNVEKDLEFLRTVDKLLKRREEASDFPSNITGRPTAFVDAAPVTPTDRTYTDQERAAAQPKGYYEILNLFYGYKDSLTRGKDFEIYSRIITPNIMAQILNETLELGFAGPAGPNINDALTEMGNRINNKEIDASHMQRFVGRLAEELGEEARAA